VALAANLLLAPTVVRDVDYHDDEGADVVEDGGEVVRVSVEALGGSALLEIDACDSAHRF